MTHPAPANPGTSTEARAWDQRGFVLVSKAGPLPLVHSFHLPEWQAELALKQAEQTLPAELRDGLAVVPATLSFQFPTEPNPAT